MMYYDVFFNKVTTGLTELTDPVTGNTFYAVSPTDLGIILDLPGPKQCTVYALTDVRRGTDLYHCLVTQTQMDFIEENNIPHIPLVSVTNAFFDQSTGGPIHVFNPAGIVFRENGQNKIHRVNNATAELLDQGEE